MYLMMSVRDGRIFDLWIKEGGRLNYGVTGSSEGPLHEESNTANRYFLLKIFQSVQIEAMGNKTP